MTAAEITSGQSDAALNFLSVMLGLVLHNRKRQKNMPLSAMSCCPDCLKYVRLWENTDGRLAVQRTPKTADLTVESKGLYGHRGYKHSIVLASLCTHNNG